MENNDIKVDFAKIFHKTSKKFYKSINRDRSEWPTEWKTTYYKSYPRLGKISLPIAKHLMSGGLLETMQRRSSKRDFRASPVSLRDISALLYFSCGEVGVLGSSGRARRAQPSGGARFPIEVYPFVVRGTNVDSGLYHYNVKGHQLDVLLNRHFNDEILDSLFIYPWAKDAGVIFLMTAVFERTMCKYGERGYRYILIEAGHIGQNMYLVSEALKLKCCALTGTQDENLEKLIDIDGISESVVYAVAVGK